MKNVIALRNSLKVSGGTVKNAAVLSGLLGIILGGHAAAAPAPLAQDLKLECDVQFAVNEFGKPVLNFPATVPNSAGLPVFQTYWITVDWKTRTGKAYLVPQDGATQPGTFETYKLQSEASWDIIEMTPAPAQGDEFLPGGIAPTTPAVAPIFYIRRNTGWFMRAEAKPGIVEIGVCGSGHKF